MFLFYGNKLLSDFDWSYDHPAHPKILVLLISNRQSLPIVDRANHPPGIAAAKPTLENPLDSTVLFPPSPLSVFLQAQASDRWPIIHTDRLKPLKSLLDLFLFLSFS